MVLLPLCFVAVSGCEAVEPRKQHQSLEGRGGEGMRTPPVGGQPVDDEEEVMLVQKNLVLTHDVDLVLRASRRELVASRTFPVCGWVC